MKAKTLLVAVAMACGFMSAAAQSEGEFRVGVGLGMNVSQLTNIDYNSRVGFNLGLRGEYYFTDDVYLGTGLLYSLQGARLSNNGATSKLSPGYLQIPVHIGARMGLGDNLALFGEFGPYFAVGVSGKTKLSSGGLDISEDFFGDPDKDYAKRFDCGLGLRAGVEVHQFQIGVGYDFGLVKIYKDGKSVRNSNFNLGVAYMF